MFKGPTEHPPSIASHLGKNVFGSEPLVFDSTCAPAVELRSDPVYDVLLLPRLGEVCAALLVEARNDLLEFVDGVVLDSVPDLLKCHIVR